MPGGFKTYRGIRL